MVTASRVLRGVLRSRLLHFALLGGSLLALAPKERDGRAVRIDESRVDRALRNERARVGRDLSTQEKQRVVQELIDEEMLFREGRRLGLDLDDAFVRTRVAESMRRTLAAAVPNLKLDERAISDEASRLAVSARLRARVRLWFVASERPRAYEMAKELAESIADSKSAEAPPKGPDEPPISEDAWYTEDSLSKIVGRDVAKVVFRTPVNAVSEPVASAWGFYVVEPIERRAMSAEELRAEAVLSLKMKLARTEIAGVAERLSEAAEIIVDVPPGEPKFDRANHHRLGEEIDRP